MTWYLRALDTAARSAQYADVRLVETSQERFVVRNGVVDTLSMDESLGIGVRVLVDGAWGFASSNLLSPAEGRPGRRDCRGGGQGLGQPERRPGGTGASGDQPRRLHHAR